MEESLGGTFGIASVIAVASITPGPNNLIVMRAATRGGLDEALAAIAGIVLGSVAMLGLILAGAHWAFAAHPEFRVLVAAAGCVYLCCLGARLVASSFASVDTTAQQANKGTPRALRLFVFQFLNLKAWALVLTAAAAASADGGALRAFAEVGTLLVLISTASLVLWSQAGAFLARRLAVERNRQWFDRAMGLLLIAAALLTWSQA